MRILEITRSDPSRALDVVAKALENAKRYSQYNYFLYLNERAVEEVEGLLKARRCGQLCGLPVVVKDNIDVANMPVTNGAPYLKRIAETTAHVVKLLTSEGAVVLGKTNLHELALGATNLNPHFGPTLNPSDPTRITGGSSGGSAGAVALGIAPLGLGTDTGGSTRIPAALCGIVGYKPPYGRYSLDGVAPLAPSLDHVGFLTRSVSDLLAVLRSIKYVGPIDPPKKFEALIIVDTQLSKHVERTFWKAIEIIESAGGIREEGKLNLKKYRYARAAILLSEAAEIHLDHLKAFGNKMGKDVATLLRMGVALPSIAYVRAKRIQNDARNFFAKLFKKYDVLITPTTAIEAPTINEADSLDIRPKLLAYTELSNLTGYPSISVPAPSNGLPVGIQIIGRDEETTLSIALAYEEASS